MKKAIAYMMIGAATYGVISMMVCKKNSIEKKLKKLKKNGMDAYNKVKTILWMSIAYDRHFFKAKKLINS